MTRTLGLLALLPLLACAPVATGDSEEGGANANDRTGGNAEGDTLETGAMAVSPDGSYIVARRNTTTLIVSVRDQALTELEMVGERFVFSKTRPVVYVLLANRAGVVALDLATRRELWRTVPAFKANAGASLARVTDDDTALLIGDHDRLFSIDPKDGDVRGVTSLGAEPFDLELLAGGRHALVVGKTTWADGGPHTPVSLVDVAAQKALATIDVPNCAAPLAVLPDGTRALLSPTFCTPGEEHRKQGWSNPDPVSMIDVDAQAGKLVFLKNLPGFGPVSLLADGRAVAYLDTKRMDPAMFDDPSEVPGEGADQYHLMTIDPRSMAFDLHPIGASLPRFAPSRDGETLLVDASTNVVRSEATASVTIDSSGKISASVTGAFGDTSGSLFGAFDLRTHAYAPFSGPGAALDRFVQLGDGSRVFTLKDNGRGGDLFAIDVNARSSVDLGKSLRDIGILPDGRTLVLRIRLEPTWDGHLREEFCLSRDAVTCDARIAYESPTPQHDP